MAFSGKTRIFAGSLALTGFVLAGAIFIHIVTRPSPGSAEADLARADEMAFNNNWIGAAPQYRKAMLGFRQKGDLPRALYAQASQIPAVMEARPLPDLIAETDRLLNQPVAADRRTHLRILTIKGMLELEYDAGQAKSIWAEVETEASQIGEHRLASRARGEQGILAFLLGDVAEASRRVKRAYGMAMLLMDRPAEVRYASLIGRGIVELGRYQESFEYLDKAIKIAAEHQEIAKPLIAYRAKVTALTGLARYDEALALAESLIQTGRARHLREHLAEGLQAKAAILEAKGDWHGAIRCYAEAIQR